MPTWLLTPKQAAFAVRHQNNYRWVDTWKYLAGALGIDADTRVATGVGSRRGAADAAKHL